MSGKSLTNLNVRLAAEVGVGDYFYTLPIELFERLLLVAPEERCWKEKKWKSKNDAGRFSLELNTPKYINVFRQPSKKAAGVRNENRGFYVATGIVQRRDVSIHYSVILDRFTQYT